MKICINYGHALSGAGTGAVGIKKESEETRNTGKEVVTYLKGNSTHEILVADFEGEDNYVKATNFANSEGVDLFVSIHFNSGAGDLTGNGVTTGTEVLIGHLGSSALDEAQRIVNNISKLGFKNRGIKERPDLYVLKHTKMGACLVECAFLDDMDDMKAYNPKLMAKAIAEGILNKTISEQNNVVSSFKNGDYSGRKARVNTDVLRVRYNRGTGYDIIGKLSKGETVNLNYCLNKWVSIEGFRGNNGLGYVHTDYLELV